MKPKMYTADITITKDEKTVIFAAVKARTLDGVKSKANKVVKREVCDIPDNEFGVMVSIVISNERDEYIDSDEFHGNVKDKIFIVEV